MEFAQLPIIESGQFLARPIAERGEPSFAEVEEEEKKEEATLMLKPSIIVL